MFRQALRELSDWHELFCGRLVAPPSWYFGPSRLLAKVLRQQGWHQAGPLIFADEWGRMFNLLLTSESLIQRLLTSKWMDRVAREVRHRKYLRGLSSISLPLTRAELWLSPGQRPLVYQQWTGATFSKDHAKAFCENRGICPLCQGLTTGGIVLMYCPGTLFLRDRLGCCTQMGRVCTLVFLSCNCLLEQSSMHYRMVSGILSGLELCPPRANRLFGQNFLQV